MCLTVLAGDLGAAHLGLDVQRLVMVLSPHLDKVQRVVLARRALARAGQEQPVAMSSEVICLCGLLLDLTLPMMLFPAQRSSSPQPAAGGELVLEASTGSFPAVNTGSFPAISDDLLELTPLLG